MDVHTENKHRHILKPFTIKGIFSSKTEINVEKIKHDQKTIKNKQMQ